MIKKIVLVLLFAFSLFAGESGEVGIPYYRDQLFGPDSATLSSTAEKLYTLKGDLVTGYETNPMKMIFSFHTGIEKGYRGCRILVTQDDQRIILFSDEYIQLWDIKTKKLVKKVYFASKKAISSQFGLIVLTNSNRLEILNDQNLETIRNTDDDYVYKIKTADNYAYSYCDEMFTNKNILLLRFYNAVMFIDLETFKIVDQAAYEDNMSPLMISYLEKYNSFFTDSRLITLLQRDYFAQSERLTYSVLTTDNNAYDEVFFSHNRKGPVQITKTSHDSSKKEKRYLFLQFDDAWLFYEYKTRLFTGSENIKKYLQMKTKDGKILPMNDETFEKYNQPLNIKAN